MILIENDLNYSQRLCTTLKLPEIDDDSFKFPEDIRGRIVKTLSTDGVLRDFNITGGQPFHEKNIDFVLSIVMAIRVAYPKVIITLQSSHSFGQLIKNKDERVRQILKRINFLKNKDTSVAIDIGKEF